ncbi:hypothetical protein O3797_04150 [Gemella sanguinis]|jgi:hypothetical protein|uniref:CsbD family protein n=1 Tax=Gemella sanguinis TaxID=84135 RepID=A0A2N6SGH9_9BACL|nr:hypothetical protein [Gemella sanguinis]EGF86599.1 hypothetical protein HMPREF0433_01402 [Gemella sanguinis M325]PMC53028.1 hypothetical protein CJ218_00330 [Gemella sanguinis]QGS07189.1 hypothetical protein FOC50_02255 [Gemella sanguinis]
MSFEDKINQAKDSIKEGLEKITGDKNIELENVVSKVKEVAEGSKGNVEGAIDTVKNLFKKD